LGVSDLNLSRVPPGRLKALAHYAAAAKAQSMARMPEDRRMATLAAFVWVYESVAQDDALDLLNQLITLRLVRAESRGDKQRIPSPPWTQRPCGCARWA
jgi:hypothetical protein